MAFDRKSLSGSAGTGVNTPALYRYNTSDTGGTVGSSNYFLEDVNILEVGDIIHAECTNQNIIFTVATSTATSLTVTAEFTEV